MPAKYNKSPKKQLTEKEIKAAKARKEQTTFVIKSKKKPEPSFFSRWIDGMPKEKARRLLWIGIAVCGVFIVAATVILINMYTVFTRGTKIDLYAEGMDYDSFYQLYSDIQRKYGFNAAIDELPANISEVDGFNYKLLEYAFGMELDKLTQMNYSQDYDAPDRFYPINDGEAVDVMLNDAAVLTVPVVYEPTGNGFSITIDGKEFKQDSVLSDPYVFTALYDSTEHNRVILCGDDAYGAASGQVFAYYHDGTEAHYIGSIPVSPMAVRVSNQRYLSYAAPSAIFQNRAFNNRLVMDFGNNYELIQGKLPIVGYYDFTVAVNVFTREDIVVYASPDISSATDVLPAATVVELNGTDEQAFIRGETKEGTAFYMWVPEPNVIDAGGERYLATDLLFGL